MVTSVLLVVGLVGPPQSARGAGGTIATTAQGLRVALSLLGTSIPVNTQQSTWQTGQAASNSNVANPSVPALGANVLGTGAVTTAAEPIAGGGTASAEVDNLSVGGTNAIGADVIKTHCNMSATDLSGGSDTTNLKIGTTTVNPTVNQPISIANVLTGQADKETATYNTSTGKLSWTIHGLDLTLLGGPLAAVAAGTVVVAESTCSGVVTLDSLNTTSKPIVPGGNATPSVQVVNNGDVAAPNTVITIPAPPTGYTVGTVTTSGGGTCTPSTTQIRCTGVKVPGSGSVSVSLPVTLSASATTAANWAPAAGTITAVSTPIAALTGTTISVSGSGTLTTVGPAAGSGNFVITPMTLAAGKSGTTPITINNTGPSDATTTVTIPLDGRPAGITSVTASVGTTPCLVTAASITCSNVLVPGNGSASVSVKVTAASTAVRGATWNLANLAATLNGTAISGQGLLLTISDPDVNLSGGVTINAVNGVPGGGTATPTVRVTNTGAIASTGTTITLPAPPAGYTLGTVTTTGGGSCTTTSGISCTGVTVPAMGSVTVSVPVTLASNVTADWTSVVAGPVTATNGDSTGQATGAIVRARPDYTLAVTYTGPTPTNPQPGGTTTITADVTNQGPSDAKGAVFLINAPGSTTFAQLTTPTSAACFALSPTSLKCTVDLVAHADVVLTLPLLISSQADPSGPLLGGCFSFNADSDCADSTDVALPPITLDSPLSRRITITPIPVTITPGRPGIARIRLTSVRAETSLRVVVPLSLPTGFHVTLVGTTSSTGTCVLGSQIDCTGLSLAANQSIDITITVTLDSSVQQSVRWTVNGILVSDGTDTVSVNGTLVIAGAPDWTVTATVDVPADNTVEPGGTGTITVVLHNQGPSDATSVSFVVLAPDSSTFLDLTGPTAGVCSLASTTRAVCTLPSLVANADSIQLIFKFLVASTADPDITIRGCVSLSGNTGCSGPRDVVIGPIVLRVAFDHRVNISINTGQIVPGETGTGTIRITATHGDLTGLTIRIPLGGLPIGVQVNLYSATTGSCTIDTVANEVVCTGVNILDGATGVITLTISVGAAVKAGIAWDVTNIRIVYGSSTVTVRGRLVLVSSPKTDVKVTFLPPSGPLAPGGRGDLTITIDNDGPSDAYQQTIIVLAPDGATFDANLTGFAGQYCRLVDSGTLSCTLDVTVAANPIVLIVTLVVAASADPNTPLTGGCWDTNADGVCTITIDIFMPDITLTYAFNRQISITTVPVTVTPVSVTASPQVKITSIVAQTNLTVSISLTGKPTAALSILASTDGGGLCAANLAGTALTCTGVNIAAGGTVTITLLVTVLAGSTDVEWFTPSIVVISTGGGTATGAGLLLRTGTPTYRLDATFAPNPGPTTLRGDVATLTATIVNTGTTPATNAVVNILAPFGTVFDPLTGAVGSACRALSATRATCLVTLAPGGASLVWQIPLRISGNYGGTQVTGGTGCLDLGGDNDCNGTWDVSFPDIPVRTSLRFITVINYTPVQIAPGGTGTGTITIRINQPRAGVTLLLAKAGLPAGITINYLRYGATQLDCTDVGDSYSCGPMDFTGGGEYTFTISVTASVNVTTNVAWSPSITIVFGSERYVRTITLVVITSTAVNITVGVPDDGELYPGGLGDLRIVLHNPGPVIVRNIHYVFRAPRYTTFVALPPAVDQYCDRISSTVVDCSIDVDVNVDVVFVLQIYVSPDVDPSVLIDGGCIDLNFDGLCTSVDYLIHVIVLGSAIAGDVAVDTESGGAVPGTTGTGYVTIRNRTSVTITGLKVTIPLGTLPAGFNVTGYSGPTGSLCTKTDTQIQCTNVTVAPGLQRVINLTVTTASNLSRGVSWIAYAIAVSRTGQSAQGSGLIVITLAPQSHLTATIDGPGTLTPGTSSSMTVTIVNTGPSDAVNQTAIVVAAGQTTFGPLTGRAAQECTLVDASHLNCTFSIVANGPSVIWQLVLLVSSSADPTKPTTGACVALNGDTATCSNYGLHRPLAQTTTIALFPATIPPGNTGTPTIRISTTADLIGLKLIVPLDDLPAGFTVTKAMAGTTACQLQSTQISCSGLSMDANSQLTVTLTVTVAATVTTTKRWTATSITLTEDAYPADQLISTGLLASTSAATSAVTITIGGPTTNPAAPGQTTRLLIHLHNAGPADASPYVMVLVLPDGLTPGAPLPTGCLWNESPNTMRCELNIAVNVDVTLRLPLVVSTTVPIGTVITGGCIDAATSVDPWVFDYTCDDAGDLPLPAISVVSPTVDVAIRYPGDTLQAALGSPIWAGLNYSNNGSQTAKDVTFTIDPPAGVTVAYAGILLDATTASASGLSLARYEKEAHAAANLTQPDQSDLTDLTCTADPDGDSNTVSCTGPDAPVGLSSQLWVQLAVAADAPTGVQTMHVTIGTTSPEGKFVNNYADVLLDVGETDAVTQEPTTAPTTAPTSPTASPTDTFALPTSPTATATSSRTATPIDNPTYHNPPPPYYNAAPLPKTGQDVSGLLLLSVMLVVGGVASRIVARDRPRRRPADMNAGSV